jgi:hypothetical protein
LEELIMPTYLYVYHGGSTPSSPEEGEKAMAAWGAWFEGLGAAVVDGGNPVGQSMTVFLGGVTEDGGANPVSGYSKVQAENMDAAIEMARGCPIIEDGGSVEVAEAMPM